MNANVIMPCPQCLGIRISNPASFSRSKCETAILFGTTLKCDRANHEVEIEQV
jgi:hypothetical protein